jgi:TonB family protein
MTSRSINQTLLIGFGLALLSAPSQLAQQQSLTPDEIMQRTGASVVVLSGTDETGKSLTPGLGFVIAPGVVATSNDVVKDAVTINARSRDREMRADIFAVNLQRTVALLKTYDYANNTKFYYGKIPALPLASSGTLAPGDRIYVETATGLSQISVRSTVAVRGREYPEIKFKLAEADRGSLVVNQYGEVLGLVGLTGPASKRVPYLVAASVVADADKPSRSKPDEDKGAPPGGVPGYVIGKEPAGDSPGSSPSGGGSAERQTAPGVIVKHGTVLQGMAIRRVEPSYPPMARAAKVGGQVVVEVTIDERGYVIAASPITGNPLLKDAATAAAMGWKFVATTFDGRPVKVIGTIAFNFQI